ncbi:MAG: hypothetical protein ACRCX2_13285 [Paraclostridium sp.]
MKLGDHNINGVEICAIRELTKESKRSLNRIYVANGNCSGISCYDNECPFNSIFFKMYNEKGELVKDVCQLRKNPNILEFLITGKVGDVCFDF